MLGEEDRVILDFERFWAAETGPKDQAIEFGLGLSSAGYYERLLDLLDDPDAFAYDPLTVKRVRSVLDSRAGREKAVS